LQISQVKSFIVIELLFGYYYKLLL